MYIVQLPSISFCLPFCLSGVFRSVSLCPSLSLFPCVSSQACISPLAPSVFSTLSPCNFPPSVSLPLCLPPLFSLSIFSALMFSHSVSSSLCLSPLFPIHSPFCLFLCVFPSVSPSFFPAVCLNVRCARTNDNTLARLLGRIHAVLSVKTVKK